MESFDRVSRWSRLIVKIALTLVLLIACVVLIVSGEPHRAAGFAIGALMLWFGWWPRWWAPR